MLTKIQDGVYREQQGNRVIDYAKGEYTVCPIVHKDGCILNVDLRPHGKRSKIVTVVARLEEFTEQEIEEAQNVDMQIRYSNGEIVGWRMFGLHESKPVGIIQKQYDSAEVIRIGGRK